MKNLLIGGKFHIDKDNFYGIIKLITGGNMTNNEKDFLLNKAKLSEDDICNAKIEYKNAKRVLTVQKDSETQCRTFDEFGREVFNFSDDLEAKLAAYDYISQGREVEYGSATEKGSSIGLYVSPKIHETENA